MLKQMLIDTSKYGIKCPYSMTPKGICIHNSANDASALAERNNVNRWDNDAEVSFHIAIDDEEAIQLIPFNRNAWHAGDGGNGNGNRNYIAIEVCYSLSGGERFINAEKRAAKEVAALLKQYGWTINNVKKHQDFSNKYCPHRTLDMGWQRFLNMVQAELNGSSQSVTNNPGELYRVRKNWGDASSQVGAFRNLQNAKDCASANPGYGVFDGNGAKIYPVETINKKYLNLKSNVPSWRVYPLSKSPVIGNEVGSLAPSRYGGLSYEMLGNPQSNVYTIKTESFGTVNIYAPRDNDSSITNNPIY